jgi:hypothetical protein
MNDNMDQIATARSGYDEARTSAATGESIDAIN